MGRDPDLVRDRVPGVGQLVAVASVVREAPPDRGSWTPVSRAVLRLGRYRLYLRLADDGRGRWRTRDFYLRGDWRQVTGADLREMDLSALEEIVLADLEHLGRRAQVPGPDLERLASSFSTVFGPGLYARRHCESCDAPLRGRSPRPDDRWSNDWVGLSWFAQFDDVKKIARPRHRRAPAKAERYESRPVPRLQRPTDGLTDEFLTHVRDAYRLALAEGKAPAPELPRQIDGSDRTIHTWVSVARKRGIMPPASRPGRAG